MGVNTGAPQAVSVVIAHFGDPAPTLGLVQALRANDLGDDCQIIVSDDASEQPFPNPTDTLHYDLVRRRRNGGFGAAVNSALEVVQHPLLLILNSDVTIGAGFLRQLLDAAQPWWPAVVSTRVLHPTGEACVARSWPTVGQQMAEWLQPLARFHGTDLLERSIGNDMDGFRKTVPVLTDWAIGVCLLLPTQDVRAVGGFDERYFMNCEEIDLQRRLHDERGLPVVVLPAPAIEHASGASSDSSRRAGWLTDARFRYHHKWRGGPGLRRGLRTVTAVNLLWNGARQALGREVDALSDYRLQRALIEHGWRTRTGVEAQEAHDGP